MQAKEGAKNDNKIDPHAPGPDSGEATESAVESYEQTERADSPLHPGSGDRNTASGSATEDLNE